MISMQNMKYIVEIAKQHSISSAAKSLFVSQSTLSTAVREVEQQLGISIFKRNNRGIEVTFEGQDFLNHAKDIVEQSEYLERRYKHRKTLPMRFSVSTQRLPFSVMSFIQIVEDLELRHYDIAIRECPTHEVIHDVASRRSELGILCINEHYLNTMQKLLDSSNLGFYELGQLTTYVFLRKKHPLSGNTSLTLDMLREYPFVTYDQGEDSMMHFSEEILFNEIWDKNIHVIDRCSKIALVRGTNCFSIGPDLTNSDADRMHSNMSEVRAIRLLDNDQRLHAGYILRNEHGLSAIGEKYIKVLTEKIKAFEKWD